MAFGVAQRELCCGCAMLSGGNHEPGAGTREGLSGSLPDPAGCSGDHHHF